MTIQNTGVYADVVVAECKDTESWDLNNFIQTPDGEVILPTTAAHSDILHQLLEQIQPVDFRAEVHPITTALKDKRDNELQEGGDSEGTLNKLKVGRKHYLIITIEKLLNTALLLRWGLCKRNGFVYLYNGEFWKSIDPDNFQDFLGNAAEKMGVPKFDARYHQFRGDLSKQFMAVAVLPEPRTTDDLVRINLSNGTFEISSHNTGLKEFNRNNFLTYQLPFSYAPEAEAPIFKRYLDRVLPDASRQNVLAEYLGYVFMRNGSKALKIEKALILLGGGANGKSVFFDITSALFGRDNVCNYSLQNLTDSSGYYRAKLGEALVNYASEINGKLESSFFKQLVSGEPVEARLPYHDPFTLTQYAKLIFNANELPKDVEHTNAFFRRFLIIPFDETIPEDEQDKELSKKIIEQELSGVFNWVLEGLGRLLSQKSFTKCTAAEDALKLYRKESDSVQTFLEDEGYKNDFENYELIKNIYPCYRGYCVNDGIHPVSKKNFTKRLRDCGYKVGNVTGNQTAVYVSAPAANDFLL